MTGRPGTPPERMRTYRVEAELRESPDLHKLAQLFLGMALQRAENDRRDRPDTGTATAPVAGREVES